MTVDIAKSIFRTLALEGVQFSEGFFKTLSNIYLREAQETVIRYENDAAINCLSFDRHTESTAVEAFADGINLAGDVFWGDPSVQNLIPNWHRVIAALPDFFEHLREAVKLDNTSALYCPGDKDFLKLSSCDSCLPGG
jgi:glucosyl-3-phosphoglycerate synthase